MSKSLLKRAAAKKAAMAAEEQATELAIAKLREACDISDISLLYALHTGSEKMGKKRLLRVYSEWLSIQMDMIERFRSPGDTQDDYGDLLIMKERLAEIGVTMEDLRAIASEEDRKFYNYKKKRGELPT